MRSEAISVLINNHEYSLFKKALSDLDKISRYISSALENPIAADSVINGIMDTIDLLEDQPLLGKPLYFDNNLFSGFRYLIYHNYLAFYHTEDNDAYIDRVLYGKSDYLRILFNF